MEITYTIIGIIAGLYISQTKIWKRLCKLDFTKRKSNCCNIHIGSSGEVKPE